MKEKFAEIFITEENSFVKIILDENDLYETRFNIDFYTKEKKYELLKYEGFGNAKITKNDSIEKVFKMLEYYKELKDEYIESIWFFCNNIDRFIYIAENAVFLELKNWKDYVKDIARNLMTPKVFDEWDAFINYELLRKHLERQDILYIKKICQDRYFIIRLKPVSC